MYVQQEQGDVSARQHGLHRYVVRGRQLGRGRRWRLFNGQLLVQQPPALSRGRAVQVNLDAAIGIVCQAQSPLGCRCHDGVHGVSVVFHASEADRHNDACTYALCGARANSGEQRRALRACLKGWRRHLPGLIVPHVAVLAAPAIGRARAVGTALGGGGGEGPKVARTGVSRMRARDAHTDIQKHTETIRVASLHTDESKSNTRTQMGNYADGQLTQRRICKDFAGRRLARHNVLESRRDDRYGAAIATAYAFDGVAGRSIDCGNGALAVCVTGQPQTGACDRCSIDSPVGTSTQSSLAPLHAFLMRTAPTSVSTLNLTGVLWAVDILLRVHL